MRYHITVMRPEGDGLFYTQAFNEVIETLAYGLVALGHQVSHKTNTYVVKPGVQNIVVGPQFAKAETEFPEGTILYNLEQCGGNPLQMILPELTQRYTLWDYSLNNCEYWRKLGIRAHYAPIGYVPQLTRISPVPRPDIDVLFYGSLNRRRADALGPLQQTPGLKVTVFKGFGRERDDVIARSKVVLNLHYYDSPHLFEQPRVAYLLANMKAVVCETSDDFPAWLIGAVREAPYKGLADACRDLVKDIDARYYLQEQGYKCFSRLREMDILRDLLKSCDNAADPDPSNPRPAPVSQ